MMFSSPLMKDWGYHTAGMYTVEDLDRYDSKLTHELMALHDQIHLNPVRGVVPEYRSEYGGRQVYQFTFGAVQNQLLPAVNSALQKLSPKAKAKAQKYVQESVRHLNLARNAASGHMMEEAGYNVETAFSKLHNAIEVVREDTRKAIGRNVRVPSITPAKGLSDIL